MTDRDTVTDAAPVTWLAHGKISLALHQLRAAGAAQPLLLLHGLGERSPATVPPIAAAWPGPVWALDLTGHGASTMPCGGGYTAEVLTADVDVALAELGPATILGRGLGAYLALLITGARTDLVRGVVLADGPGLAGGGTSPGSPSVLVPPPATGRTPDGLALQEMSRDIRPPDYAVTFARQALQTSPLEAPIVVSAVVRPPWLAAVADEPGVVVAPVPEALARYA